MMRSLSFRVGLSSGLVGVALIGLLAVVGMGCSSSEAKGAAGSGGSSTTDGGQGGQTSCNGVLDDAGVCVPKCHNSQCKAGNICVDNACKLQCKGHNDCPSGWDCVAAVADEDGANTSVCQSASYPHGEGEFFASCSGGNKCKTDEGFVCFGGEDDPDAYCSKWDCKTDDECPPSMYCGVGRVFRKICDDPDFKPLYVDPDQKCINKADMTSDGHTFRKGPISLLRGLCRPRSFCAPCETDLDCSRSGFNKCIKDDAKAPGYCSRTCDKNLRDCPWQGASKCGLTSSPQGDMCNPTAGSCVGDGKACSMCRSDLDCWKSGDEHRKACLHAGMSGEPYCVDLDFDCSKDDDCPDSPAGKMHCLQSIEVQSGSPFLHRCYPRDNGLLQPGQASCYENPKIH